MLIQFTVGNYRTFKEKATLSLVASNYDKKFRVEENTSSVAKFNLKLLKSAVLYGANASGKSKFFEALSFMKTMAINSFRVMQVDDPIPNNPFKLEAGYEEKPSYFEIIFYHDNSLVRYGFEVNSKEFLSEWLFIRESNKEVRIFEKVGQEVKFHPKLFKIGNFLGEQELLRNNATILSSSAQSNNPKVASVVNWMKKLKILSSHKEWLFESYSVGLLSSNEQSAKILELLQVADLGISNVSASQMDSKDVLSKLPDNFRLSLKEDFESNRIAIPPKIKTIHKKYTTQKIIVDSVEFSMEEDESDGTYKFFKLSGPILEAIDNGSILVIDELDSQLHPNLACKIAEMFNSNNINSNNSQLIFTTHNTNLLDSGIFRRDQIWFTEKDKYGSAKLYSLSDIKVRSNDKFEENYILGKYGAIPYLNRYDRLIKQNFVNDNL